MFYSGQYHQNQIVTNDKHFQVLKNIDFPKIEVTSVNDFAERLGINF